ncbi:hypothetical protein BD310DRAFT_971318 [Dichomitus squalens]|uniref:Uncharacterized protein n=1 Tax=Dichomitus squalens TaxID=114155 RepID=A0A4Q9PE08_9APHY|nr:hypothetical protein BD310DRAFT_971318 [Dichomitus squalens]
MPKNSGISGGCPSSAMVQERMVKNFSESSKERNIWLLSCATVLLVQFHVVAFFFAAAAPTNKYCTLDLDQEQLSFDYFHAYHLYSIHLTVNLGMNLNRDLEDLTKYLVLGQVDPPDLAKSIGLGVLEVLGILEVLGQVPQVPVQVRDVFLMESYGLDVVDQGTGRAAGVVELGELNLHVMGGACVVAGPSSEVAEI